MMLPSCLLKSRPATPPNSAPRRGRIATHARSIAMPDNSREATHRIAHQFVKSSILFLIAEIVDFEFQTAQTRASTDLPAPVGMGSPEGVEKCSFVRGREVADLENDFKMRRGNRRGIGRVGHLGDETAVLAQRGGEPLPCARRPLIQYIAQDGLVRLDIGRFRVPSRRVGHPRLLRSTRAIASLARPSAAGLTDRALRPAPSSASICFGSPPASPHRLTLRPTRAP